jgi:dihydrofolate reductase
MKLIAAVNKLGYIGLNNTIPWKCTEDLRHFKKMTLNQKLLVGRKTYESLPPFKNRELLIVGKDYLTLEQALELKPDWVIGGATIYKQLALLCDEWHISTIRNNNVIGDTLLELPQPTKNIKIYHYYFNDNNS